jgi:hypothetical protein
MEISNQGSKARHALIIGAMDKLNISVTLACKVSI